MSAGEALDPFAELLVAGSYNRAMRYLVALAFLLALSCVSSDSAWSKLGGEPSAGCVLSRMPRIDEKLADCPASFLEMLGPSELAPAARVRSAGIAFFVAFNENGRIKSISTADPKFYSGEGVHVGSTLREVTAAGGDKPQMLPGWGYYSHLPSGWNAGFGVGEDMTSGPLVAGSRAKWLFRR
jgi:hypothetical protein